MVVALFLVLVGIEQTVQMRHEITHLRVIDARLRLRPPRRNGGGMIGKQADDFDFIEIS